SSRRTYLLPLPPRAELVFPVLFVFVVPPFARAGALASAVAPRAEDAAARVGPRPVLPPAGAFFEVDAVEATFVLPRVDARDPPSAVAGLRRLEPAAAPAFAFPRPPDWALVAAAPADEFAAVDALRVVPVERPLVAEARAPVSAAVVFAVLRP